MKQIWDIRASPAVLGTALYFHTWRVKIQIYGSISFHPTLQIDKILRFVYYFLPAYLSLFFSFLFFLCLSFCPIFSLFNFFFLCSPSLLRSLTLFSVLSLFSIARKKEITWVEHGVAWGWRRGADLGLGVLGVTWVDGLSADLGLGVLGVAWVDDLGADLGVGLLGVGLGWRRGAFLGVGWANLAVVVEPWFERSRHGRYSWEKLLEWAFGSSKGGWCLYGGSGKN